MISYNVTYSMQKLDMFSNNVCPKKVAKCCSTTMQRLAVTGDGLLSWHRGYLWQEPWVKIIMV